MFAQQNYPQKLSGVDATIAEAGSLLVAFSNLLEQANGEQIDPPTLLQFFADHEIEVIDWTTISVYDLSIAIDQIGEGPTPPKMPVMVRFYTTSPLTGKYGDFYCAVDRIEAGKVFIVDSWDGVVKAPEVYEPNYGGVTGWATYKRAVPSLAHTYVMRANQSIWEAARYLRIPVDELIEHNEIEKPLEIGEGYRLHLPVVKKSTQKPRLRYQKLDEPRIMHVSVEAGVRKYSFGNAKESKDIAGTGPTFPKGREFTIIGIAQVMVDDIDGELGYYIDKASWGKFTTGFRWVDLTEGVAPENLKPTIKELVPPVLPPEPVITHVTEPEQVPSWKQQVHDTWLPYEEGPVLFRAKERMLVRDLGTVRQPKEVFRHQEIAIAGTFVFNGVEYGRPVGAVNAGLLWAIPMHKMEEILVETAEDKELYTTTQEVLKPKLAIRNGKLTVVENMVSVPLAKATAPANSILQFIKQKRKK
jgi:hypothetical protein